MNRTEQIMVQVLSVLTGLSTTGSNVKRDRLYPVKSAPFLTILQGSDTREERPSQLNDVESNLEVIIDIHVKAQDDYSQQLNTIREEIYSSIMNSGNLSLNYVDTVTWEEDDRAELSGEAENPTVKSTSSYMVKYTHPLRSKSV